MSLATLRPRTVLTLCIVIPVVCLGLGLLLVWPALSRLGQVKHELESTQQSIQQKQQNIEQAESSAAGRPLAVAVAEPGAEERIVFLRQLARLTAESGASLASVRESTPPPQPASTTTSGGTQGRTGSLAGSPQQATGAAGAGGLAGQRPVVPAATVQELANEVTVEGTFGQLLSLLVRLENFERILSISRCRLSSGGGGAKYPQLQVVFTLSRFVATPVPPPAPGATPTSPAPATAPPPAR